MLRLDPSVCIISTHLDDAVMSCGHLISATDGTTVLTVFAGAPDQVCQPGWNEKTTNRPNARDALQVRRDEDLAAMRVIGADARHLELHESEYAPQHRQDVPTVASAIAAALDDMKPATVLFPVGVHHDDHVAVSEACLALVSVRDTEAWFAYLDMPYDLAFPTEADESLRRVRAAARLEVKRPVESTGDAKVRAASCYVSQLPSVLAVMPHDNACTNDEHYWRVQPA